MLSKLYVFIVIFFLVRDVVSVKAYAGLYLNSLVFPLKRISLYANKTAQ